MQITDVDHVSLVDRARALADKISARREQAERDRRIPVESIEEMKEAGLFRGLQSRHFGGLERPPEEFLGTVIEISSACPSTGWVLGIMGVHPFEFAQMSVELQEELYKDDSDTLVSSSYVPQGKATQAPGGFRLNGRWRSSSGVDHASWLVLGALDPNAAEAPPPPRTRTFLVPRPDYEIVDDWFVMGLGGTGSKSVILDDVFVPEHRSIKRSDIMAATGPGMAINTGPLYRLPHGAIYVAAAAAPAIGAAKGAYQEFCRQVRGYVERLSRQKRAENALVQLRLADAESLIHSAELRMMTDFREMMGLAETGQEITAEARARYGWHLAQAANDCLTAVRRIFETMGAGAIYSNNELQRFYRDAIAMRQHPTQDRDGRALGLAQAELGLPMTSVWL